MKQRKREEQRECYLSFLCGLFGHTNLESLGSTVIKDSAQTFIFVEDKVSLEQDRGCPSMPCPPRVRGDFTMCHNFDVPVFRKTEAGTRLEAPRDTGGRQVKAYN